MPEALGKTQQFQEQNGAKAGGGEIASIPTRGSSEHRSEQIRGHLSFLYEGFTYVFLVTFIRVNIFFDQCVIQVSLTVRGQICQMYAVSNPVIGVYLGYFGPLDAIFWHYKISSFCFVSGIDLSVG